MKLPKYLYKSITVAEGKPKQPNAHFIFISLSLLHPVISNHAIDNVK